jgi:predicted ABC-type ATPase
MPQLWAVGGPNGSGKTTFADRWLAGRIPVVSPDSIAAERGLQALEAGKEAVRAQEALLAALESFAVDTTLSGKRELALMRRARDAGFKVNLVFVGAQGADLSIARVAQRVAAGGHGVPPEDVRRRTVRSMVNLGPAIALADRAYVVDNTDFRPRLLFSMENGRVRRVSPRLPQWAKDAIPAALLRQDLGLVP